MRFIKNISILMLPLFIFFACALEEPDAKKTKTSTGDQDFSTYVAIGNSLTAGYQSGSLVEEHQEYSYPNLIAGQLELDDFQQPTVSYPGLPSIMTLESAGGTLGTAPGTGAPTNLTLARPYNNMGIPGIVLADVAGATSTADSYSKSSAIDLVLRGLGTQIQQALSLQPNFVSCWIGNNDVLGFATSGGGNPAIPAPTDANIFAALYAQLGADLAASGANVVLATIPNVTDIPFFTTLPGIVLDADRNPVIVNGNMVPLVGVDPTSSLILLTAAAEMAQGKGIPASLGGTGEPLPDHVFLDATELGTIAVATAAFNATIKNVANTHGFALFDANAFFSDIVAAGGYDPGAGLATLTTAYISGGLFSFDGVHPSNMGYAIIANQFINAVNSKYGTAIAEVNLRDVVGQAPKPIAKTASYDSELHKNTPTLFGGAVN